MPGPTLIRRLQAVLPWAGAYLPALGVLLYILPRRSRVPYLDSWVFVGQYQAWCEGSLGWREFFAPHNQHPSAVGKAVYFAVMHLFRGDASLLPLVTWGLALVIPLCVLALSRPVWRDRPALGAGLMFLANLSIFTLAQGHVWIWDFVFQNAIAGACLMTGLWALSADDPRWWRWALAALSGIAAAFSFGTGPAVAFLLLPAVWMALGEKPRAARLGILLLWFLGAALSGWLALEFLVLPGRSVAPPDGLGRVGVLVARPWDTVGYVLTLLGHTLGQGTVIEPVKLCAWWGAALLAVFLLGSGTVVRRRDPVLWRRAWPWMAMFLWALLNAAMICAGRLRVTLDTALAMRYGALMLFAVAGVVLLAAQLALRGGGGTAVRWLRRGFACGITLLLAFHVTAWKAGADSIEIARRKMDGERAALVFAGVIPLPASMHDPEGTARLARFLREGGRLRDVTFAEDATLARWRRGADVSDKWSHWELMRGSGGTLEMQGVCGMSKDLLATPDLVLVTASVPGEPERIVALVPPLLPEDFFDRALLRRQFHSHYFAWRWPVDRRVLPAGDAVTLRAHAFEAGQRKVRRIEGEARVGAEAP